MRAVPVRRVQRRRRRRRRSWRGRRAPRRGSRDAVVPGRGAQPEHDPGEEQRVRGDRRPRDGRHRRPRSRPASTRRHRPRAMRDAAPAISSQSSARRPALRRAVATRQHDERGEDRDPDALPDVLAPARRAPARSRRAPHARGAVSARATGRTDERDGRGGAGSPRACAASDRGTGSHARPFEKRFGQTCGCRIWREHRLPLGERRHSTVPRWLVFLSLERGTPAPPSASCRRRHGGRGSRSPAAPMPHASS